MGHEFASKQDEIKFDAHYTPVINEDIKWALETAVVVSGALDYEPKDAYFNRVKSYAKDLLLTLKELNDEVNGSIY